MKKFTKICLITALILILMGGTICVIGAVSGGWRAVRENGYSGTWQGVLDGVSYAYGWDNYDGDYDFNLEWDNDETTAQISNDYTDTGIDGDRVNELEVSIGGAALYLRESVNDNYGIKKTGVGEYRCYESGGVLYLEGNRKNVVKVGNEKVYLYIPKNTSFSSVDIEVGAGLVETGNLSGDEIELKAGAGIILSEKLNCRSLSVDVGAGKATLNDVTADELDLSVGVGYALVKGGISNKIDVDCETGIAELQLAADKMDYNYELDCEVGSITLDDNYYGVLAEDIYIDNGAAAICSVDNAVGSVNIKFNKQINN